MLTMHSFIHCVGSCPGEWVEESCASKRGTFRWCKWARNSWHCLPNFVSRWFDAKPFNMRSDHRVKSEYAFKLMQSYDNSSFTCRVFVLFSPGDERFLLIFFTFRATSWTIESLPVPKSRRKTDSRKKNRFANSAHEKFMIADPPESRPCL